MRHKYSTGYAAPHPAFAREGGGFGRGEIAAQSTAYYNQFPKCVNQRAFNAFREAQDFDNPKIRPISRPIARPNAIVPSERTFTYAA